MKSERIKQGPVRFILTKENDIFNLIRGLGASCDLEGITLDGLSSAKLEPTNIPKANPEVNLAIADSCLTIKVDQGYPQNQLHNKRLYNEEFYKRYGTYVKLIVK